ncbi:unnamed protein product [Symbiodinium microadriaticum]|nr:unnamed protein product [Symbiodinium microadriaticum]
MAQAAPEEPWKEERAKKTRPSPARFGEFYVVIVRAIPDVIAMLLMTVPSIPLHQIYAVRFVVGFFEAPWLRCPVGERGADKWSQHRRTLVLASVSSMAAILAAAGVVPDFLHWWRVPGGALTKSRAIEASVYQVQCNNPLLAMPMPCAIGKANWPIGQARVMAAVAGFSLALSDWEEERSACLEEGAHT